MNGECYLCGSARSRQVFTEDGVELRRCGECRHVYSTWEQDDHYDGYWGESTDDEVSVAFWDVAHRRVYQEFLRRHVPDSTGKLVDVGCGLGFFVAEVQRARPGWEVEGYELSPAAVEWAANHNGLADVVNEGAIEDASIEPESVDIVTMWDVIEHIPRPQALLRAVATMLKPTGFLFVQTPNWPVQYLRARAAVAADRGIVPGKRYLEARDHLNQFSRRSLARLALDTGFRPPAFEVLPPIMAVGGRSLRLGVIAKVGVYQVSRVLSWASDGRALLNPTLFAVLRPTELRTPMSQSIVGMV